MSKGIKFKNRNNEYIYPCPFYPVGSIYISTSSTNPSTYFGGTWERFANGKVLIGVNENNSNFSTVNKSGGNLTHSHKYGMQYGGYYSDVMIEGNSDAGLLNYNSSNSYTVTGGGSNIGGISHNVNGNNTASSKSVSAAHYRIIAQSEYISSLPPYVTVYIWRRTA